MNPQVQAWMPAVLSLFGTLIVVVFTAWLNTRAVIAQIDALRAEMRGETGTLRAEMGTLRAEMGTLRAEMKQSMADLEMRLTVQIANLSHRVERLEDQRGGLVRP
ncbi:MAG: hypothetical protein SFV51_17470 [Bryobacteraceae bacterium]|nr:hypothetical protein [Bryobacteraceae bacterium]